MEEEFKSPQRLPRSNAETPSTPAPVSSACLLIEAAMGPLEPMMSEGTPVACGEFKYPGRTRTKKDLMSSWLHEVESTNSGNAQESPLPAGGAPGNLGLESLVKAAMCDYKQQQQAHLSSNAAPAPDGVPQNLSIVEKQVEEFLHQTGAGTSIEAEHNEEYPSMSGQQYHNNQFVPQPSEFPHGGNKVTNNLGRNLLHLPLQTAVSTCSNNSSVKKRWLRQAISEETTDDSSMTSSCAATPSTASPTTQLATAGHLASNSVPNGFTTPLKKRRLVISDEKDDEENSGTLQGGELAANSTSPILTESGVELPLTVDVVKTEPDNEQYTVAEDIVDVVGDLKSEPEDRLENVVVTESDEIDHGRLGGAAEMVIKHENVIKPEADAVVCPEVEQIQQQSCGSNAMLDQDDDVDILRSPSPGQKMIAEDNLVKIEPEDTSGGDDVKIDVEREESMAGDKFDEIMRQVKTNEGGDSISTNEITMVKNEIDEDMPCVFNDLGGIKSGEEFTSEVKLEEKTSQTFMVATLKESNSGKEVKSTPIMAFNAKSMGEIKTLSKTDSDEPVKKKPKMEPQTSLLKPIVPKLMQNSMDVVEASSKKSLLLAATAASAAALSLPPPPPPPPPQATNSSNICTPVTPPNCTPDRSRKHGDRKALTDDDIQERLHSFHKENILFLQSRNKKSKAGPTSGSSSSSSDCKQSKSESRQSHGHSGSSHKLAQNKALANAAASSSHSKKEHKKDRIDSVTKSSSKSGSNKSHSYANALSAGTQSSSVQKSSKSVVCAATPITMDKEKNRQRSTSSSSSNSSSGAPSNAKKRQLNFGQELTKDLQQHLAKVVGGGSKHRKDSGSGRESGNSNKLDMSATKKRRESSSASATPREEHRINSISSSNVNSDNSCKVKAPSCASTCENSPVDGKNKAAATTIAACAAHGANVDDKVAQQSLSQPAFVREHVSLPHFNNIVSTTASYSLSSADSTQPSPNIPPSSALKTLSESIPLSIPPPSPGVAAAVAVAPAIQATAINTANPSLPASALPYYNTVYGKLIDNPSQQPQQSQSALVSTPPPSIVPPPSSSTAPALAPADSSVACKVNALAQAPAASNLSLSEYLDTKVKNCSTLGGYTLHSVLFGLGHNKSSNSCAASELPPIGNSIESKLPTKIHTKTASHDPRLNPILSAPEPPPAPKRKLSINEYRKRMQTQTSTDSSICGGNASALNTPTTPECPISAAVELVTSSAVVSAPVSSVTNSLASALSQYNARIDDDFFKYSREKTLLSQSAQSSNSSEPSLSFKHEDDSKKGQFSAAPTLLEKQQEKLCERLKSLKSKQHLTSINLPSVAGNDFSIKRVNSFYSPESEVYFNSSGIISDLDNCLEAISSSSTSPASSRDSSPERCTSRKLEQVGAAKQTQIHYAATMDKDRGRVKDSGGTTS